MLEFLHIDPQFDRKSLLKDAVSSTWLVADLEHKNGYKIHFLKLSHGFLKTAYFVPMSFG